MAEKTKPIYVTTWEGRMVLNDARALVRLPKVQKALARIAESVKDDPSVRKMTRGALK
ncbi:MAG: hypothetical protein SGI92_29015 [Bryobacteraceae bacterium]|nr:hypothetical protein [Bryobacteraceae bacterium]